MYQYKNTILILLAFLLICGLRLVYITADPPTTLSWSGGLFFDEGALANNARNQVLFGQWKLDEWNDFYYSPILSYVKWAVFSLFGVGMAQLRLVPVMFCWLTLGLLYLVVKQSCSRSTALLSLILLGLNYVYLMYSRLGLTEIGLLAFAVLAAYLWQSGLRAETPRRENLLMFLAGVSCFTSYIFKALVIYFLPVPLVALALLWLISPEKHRRRRLMRFAGWCLAGMLVTCIIWVILFYFPNYGPIQQAGNFVKAMAVPQTPQAFWGNVLRNPFFVVFRQTPVTLLLAFVFLLYPLYALLHDRARVEPLDLFAGLWFLAHFTFFLGYAYRPTRYYVTILPALCFLAARALVQLARLKTVRFSSRRLSPWFWAGSTIIGVIVWGFIVVPLLPVVHTGLIGRLALGFILSGLTIGGWFWLAWRWYGKTLPLPQRLFPGIALLLFLMFLGINGQQYWRWARAPQYTVRDISRELGAMLDDAYLAGLATPMLSMENRHKALYVWENFTNYENTFERFPITHLFLGEFNGEDDYYYQKFPEVMQRAVLLKYYWIRNSRFQLYSVVEPSFDDVAVSQDSYQAGEPVSVYAEVENHDPRQTRDFEVGWLLRSQTDQTVVRSPTSKVHVKAATDKETTISQQVPPGTYDLLWVFYPEAQEVYEVEDLSGQIGEAVSDGSASQGRARYAAESAGTSGFLVHGPYHPYPVGKYMVEFVLKYQADAPLGEMPLAAIDVSTETGQTILTAKTLLPQDFAASETYQTFQLPFFLEQPQPLEFRVFTHGHADLWADQIRVSYLRGTWHEGAIVVEKP